MNLFRNQDIKEVDEVNARRQARLRWLNNRAAGNAKDQRYKEQIHILREYRRQEIYNLKISVCRNCVFYTGGLCDHDLMPTPDQANGCVYFIRKKGAPEK